MNVSLYVPRKTSFTLMEIKLLEATDLQLLEISQDLGIGLNLREMRAVKDYFGKKGRNPTDVELQTIGQTWSEHCYHKAFKSRIKFNGKKINGLFRTYIAKATEEINAPWCFSVFEDNAGIIKFDKNQGIAAKIETHNHPSAVEPFGGAATGTGGVIRDVLGVWADPIACTDVLGFGPLDFDYQKLPPGMKHPRYVYQGVVAGIGNYGNNMGIPTVNGAICFDESYTGNVVVYCGCIGLLPLGKFVKNAKANDLIVLAGGKTGRDGIHGVTFASAELTEKSEQVSRSAVQIANPIEEEKLKRAVVQIRDLRLGSAITDLGGGGLSSAIGETANRFKCGALLELEKVPLKYRGLAPWEIYISESQERMLFIVPPININQALEILAQEDVEATVIGKLTSNEVLRITHLSETVAEMDVPFLFKPPESEKTAKQEIINIEELSVPEPRNLTEILLKLLASPNIASKENVIRTYDHEVKGDTVLKPLQGKCSGPNDSAVLKPLKDSPKGLVISCGINPNYGKIDSYWMAASAIDEAIRNNIATGGRRIALLDNFTWGNPEKPERLGSLIKACEACYHFAKAFKTPFISGKDSLYNESPLGPVTPTLLITAIGIVPDIELVVSMETKAPKDLIYIAGQTFNELGGSEYYKLNDLTGSAVPKVRAKEANRTYKNITKAIDKGLIKACHDLSEGGLGVAAAEMAFGGNFGLDLDLRKLPLLEITSDDQALFSESNSRFLLEIAERDRNEFEKIMGNTTLARIGKVTENTNMIVRGLKGNARIDVLLDDLMRNWKKPFSSEV
jgi:phosphoribosylformylglycinamidine synthase II